MHGPRPKPSTPTTQPSGNNQLQTAGSWVGAGANAIGNGVAMGSNAGTSIATASLTNQNRLLGDAIELAGARNSNEMLTERLRMMGVEHNQNRAKQDAEHGKSLQQTLASI